MSEFTCPELVACTRTHSTTNTTSQREQFRRQSTTLPQVGAENEEPPTGVDVEKQVEHDNLSHNEFTVGWDGDDDPLCPRSMSLFKKWVIVCIVSTGSLLV